MIILIMNMMNVNNIYIYACIINPYDLMMLMMAFANLKFYKIPHFPVNFKQFKKILAKFLG